MNLMPVMRPKGGNHATGVTVKQKQFTPMNCGLNQNYQMFKTFFVTALLLLSLRVHAQDSSVFGIVRDAKSGNFLSGATVEVEGRKIFAIADDLGRFAIRKLNPGQYNLVIRFVGYARMVYPVSVPLSGEVDIRLEETAQLTDEILVYSTRATDELPTTFTNVSRQVIAKQNFGQDLPYLLNWTPSVVTTSDAGTGFGYTGLRIRGSDATSINVTINGIPYNDAESLGTFWVDVPDIASSSESIQIQRGVGTSTNGAGAFGATINLQTISRNDEPYATVTNSVGLLGDGIKDLSYNSRRHTIGFGTGLMNDQWVIDGRFSRISSEGFIDRATAELGSYYLSAGFYSGNTMIKAMAFGGKERTYQAWYGVPESRLQNNEEAMLITAMNEGWNETQTLNLLNSGSRTFNPYTYKDQVDDYRQDHYQLHISERLNDQLTGNIAFHYTPGRGYYEEFKPKDSFFDYGLEPVLIGDSLVEESDIIRRRWLDNDFGGVTFSANLDKPRWDLTVGGGANRYTGKHFGEIIWSEVSVVPVEYRYYQSDSRKDDLNVYAKLNFTVSEKLFPFLDLQTRFINYSTQGLDNGGAILDIDEDFAFFNPKAGLVYQFSEADQLYASYSIANREPVRSDFVNAPTAAMPKSEKLHNLELGYRLQRKSLMMNGNFYFMDYKNQLIHTGKINDVGAPIRTNVDKSFRAGVEVETMIHVNEHFSINANAAYSRNRIRDFTEVLYDYGAEWDEFNLVERKLRNTEISFSPNLIAGAGLTYRISGGLEITALSKYVSRQYLDNTANRARSLDDYFVNDIRVIYSVKPNFVKEITLSLLANNILNEQYESNGYTWGYLGGGDEYRENYYFPQAGRSYLIMLAVRF
jgi:iron complex outermembrane receptor protein